MSAKRILLVYSGYEQGSWGTIAFSKPAHYYVMPGIVCCATALQQDAWFRANTQISYLYCNASVQTHHDIFADITTPIIASTALLPLSAECGFAYVLETTSGCPYRCIYCQFGHASNRIRQYPREKTNAEIATLLAQGADCIHFADSVFDADLNRAKDLLELYCKNNIRTSLFLYCSFVRIDEEIAHLYQKSQAQICVGVQTTNPTALQTIRRNHVTRLFAESGTLLRTMNVNFYTDLIFGLPRDTMHDFKKTFNDVLGIKPAFLMPFPLAIIAGTPLADMADDLQVKPIPAEDIASLQLMCDIRYDNIALSKDFTLEQLESFDDSTLAVFFFYNRFRLSLDYLESRCGIDGFSLYREIGRKTKKFLVHKGIVATNMVSIDGFHSEIFQIFVQQLAHLNCSHNERDAFEELFKIDIFRILMLTSPERIKNFKERQLLFGELQSEIACTEELEKLHVFKNTFGKVIQIGFSWDDLQRLSSLQGSIIPCKSSVFVHAPYEQWSAQVVPLRNHHEDAIEILGSTRPLKMSSFVRQLSRSIKNSSGGSEGSAQSSLRYLFQKKIVGVRKQTSALA